MKSVHAVAFFLALPGGLTNAIGAEETASAVLGATSQDKTGRQTLGVDISSAGSTPTRVKNFLISLPADAAGKVREGCAIVMANQTVHEPKLVRFCQALPAKM